MRWFWIDRFTSFESGRRATAVKACSAMEEHLQGHFAGYPVMSPSFVLEGFAQVGGILVSEATGYCHNVVLAKVSRSRIHRYAKPGEILTYSVTLESLQVDGGLVKATSHIGDELHVEAELTFAYVGRDVVDRRFFKRSDMLRMLRAYRVFEVGVDAEGNPLQVPDFLLEPDDADEPD